MYKNLFLLLLLPFMAQAQQPKSNYTWLFELPEGADFNPYAIMQHGKYLEITVGDNTGAYSMDNKWAIPPLYADLLLYAGLPVPTRFSDEGKWGLVDLKGKTVLPPTYDDIGFFSEGLASVELDGKVGFVNKKGKLVIPCRFERIDRYTSFYFSSIGCWISDQGKWGLINKKGEWIIQPTYDAIQNATNFPLWVCKDGLWGSLAGKDKWAIEPKFSKAEGKFFYFYTPSKQSPIWAVENGKWGLIDYKGNWLIQPTFDDARHFNFGNTFAKQGDLWGIIDRKGNWVVAPQFERSSGYDELSFNATSALAIANKDNKWGLLDTLGRWQVQPEYEQIDNIYLEGYTAMNSQGLWGFLTVQGKPVPNSFAYQQLTFFNSNYAAAQKDGLWGVIDEANNQILPFVFTAINYLSDGYAMVILNGKTGIIKLHLPKIKKKRKP